MTRRFRCMIVFSILASFSPGLASADSPKVEPDLAGYKTVETAAIAPVTLVTAQAKSVSPAYIFGIFARA